MDESQHMGASYTLLLLSDHSDESLANQLEKRLLPAGIVGGVERTGSFNPFLEALSRTTGELSGAFVYLNLCTQALRERFFAASREDRRLFAEHVSAEIDGCVGGLVREGARVLVNTFPIPVERLFGNFSGKEPGSFATQVRRLNSRVLEMAAQQNSVWVVDVENLAAYHGTQTWLSERYWFHAKCACKPSFVRELADEIVAVLSAISGKMIKVVVTDLDNTLWGGVIGDDGPDGIRLGGVGEGEAFQHFQRYLKLLTERGIVLAVCSKNEETTARIPFQTHGGMILREEDFVAFKANWRAKSDNIREIAAELNVGLDSVLFLDDASFERAEVRERLPEVQVLEMPDDPALYVVAVERSRLLETGTRGSAEDTERTTLYQQQGARRTLEGSASSTEEFLASLGMSGRFQAVGPSEVGRVAQLIQRSNQFNLRTQRLGVDRLNELSGREGGICVCCSLSDRFGDYGLIAAICGEVCDRALFIEEFVMSCRVLSRGVEEFLLNNLVAVARSCGADRIVGEYVPSGKNMMVKDLYGRLGFEPLPNLRDRWQLGVANYSARATHIHPVL